MLQLTPQSTVYVATQPIDFRKGIDGLAAICRNSFAIDPFSGALFVFYNKAHNAIRIITYDGQGFWLFCKRLSKGKFLYKQNSKECIYQQICYRSLYILIHNGDPTKAKLSSNWRVK